MHTRLIEYAESTALETLRIALATRKENDEAMTQLEDKILGLEHNLRYVPSVNTAQQQRDAAIAMGEDVTDLPEAATPKAGPTKESTRSAIAGLQTRLGDLRRSATNLDRNVTQAKKVLFSDIAIKVATDYAKAAEQMVRAWELMGAAEKAVEATQGNSIVSPTYLRNMQIAGSMKHPALKELTREVFSQPVILNGAGTNDKWERLFYELKDDIEPCKKPELSKSA